MSKRFEFKFNCSDTVIPSSLSYFCCPHSCTQKQLDEEYVSGVIDNYVLEKFKRLEDGSIEIPAQENCRYEGFHHPDLCLIKINLTKVWDIEIDGQRYDTELDYLKHCLIFDMSDTFGEGSPITDKYKTIYHNLKDNVKYLMENIAYDTVDKMIKYQLHDMDLRNAICEEPELSTDQNDSMFSNNLVRRVNAIEEQSGFKIPILVDPLK